MDFNVVDADGHVLEPVSAWKSLPAQYRPRIERSQGGMEHVSVGDQEVIAVSLGKLATPGSKMSDFETMIPLEEALPGGYDPKQRLKDMDAEGIDAAVLYPSLGLYFWVLKDPKAAVAIARAYNDWLSEYCATDRRRLFGAAMIPIQDPEEGARELRRAVTELGFKAGFLRPNPCNGRAISDYSHRPIWEAAEQLGVPIGIHEGSSVKIETLGIGRPINPFLLHAVSHPFEAMLAFGHLVADGVLERHPNLRFIFLESGGSWAPFWLWRLDEQVKGFGGFCPEMKLKPSEYFKRQCIMSFEIDEDALVSSIPHIGEDRVVWGSDYPHHDSTFPGATAKLRKTIAPLSESAKQKLLGKNAVSVYNLA